MIIRYQINELNDNYDNNRRLNIIALNNRVEEKKIKTHQPVTKLIFYTKHQKAHNEAFKHISCSINS